MSTSLEQSVKERLRFLANERRTSFAELWRNLILERFLARLCQSRYKDHFILKGGTLLARYITLGRETKDLDFLVQKLSNAKQSLTTTIEEICSINLSDGFSFQKVEVETLSHPHMSYVGATVCLLAKFGGTKTQVTIDLGFGDIVHAIDHSISLTSTKKGPLYESHINVRCYPKEFIFAEKLETVAYRGSANSRMKDFHDLYSLTSLPDCLKATDAEAAVTLVFNHRHTSLQEIPIKFAQEELLRLQSRWIPYHQALSIRPAQILPPQTIKDVLETLNKWLTSNTKLCH